MYGQRNAKFQWSTAWLLASILAMGTWTTDVNARSSSGGSSRGGSVSRSGGPSRSSAPRSFNSGSRSSAGRSSAGSSRSLSTPSRSYSGGRSYSAPSRSSSSGRDYSMRAPGGRSSSSVRPPAELRSSAPRVGSDYRSSQPQINRGVTPQRSFDSNYSRPSSPDLSRSMDRSINRSVPRSNDSYSGRPSREMGISRPSSVNRSRDAGSFGTMDRTSRATNDFGRSSMTSRSISRGSDTISRQIARPDSMNRSGLAQRTTNPGLSRSDRSSPVSRSLDSISRSDPVALRQIDRSTLSDRSQPRRQNNESLSRQISRPDSMSRAPGMGDLNQRITRSDLSPRTRDLASISRSPISRPLGRSPTFTDRSSVRRSSDSGRLNPSNSRTLRGGDSPRRFDRASDRSFRSVNNVSRTSLSHSYFARSARNSLRSSDIYVINAKHKGVYHWDGRNLDHWHYGGRGDRWSTRWGHGDWNYGRWGHGNWNHGYWGRGGWGGYRPGYWYGASYSGWYGGGSWFSDYGYYNYWRPSWSVSLSLGYYAAPTVVGCGFTTVYPAYAWYPWSPPVVSYYNAYAWPALYEPVVFSPIVTPVYTPVVVDPGYYYWNPAYYYYTYSTAYTSPGVAASVAISADASGNDVALPYLSESEQATAQAPTANEALDQGLAALRNGQTETARDHFARAVAADPSSGVAQMLYAAALVADGQYSTASATLRQALTTWTDVQTKDFYIPGVFADAKVTTQYGRDLRAFLSDHPDRVDGWLLAIWNSAFSGRPQEASQLLAEALKSWPVDPALQTMDKLITQEIAVAAR